MSVWALPMNYSMKGKFASFSNPFPTPFEGLDFTIQWTVSESSNPDLIIPANNQIRYFVNAPLHIDTLGSFTQTEEI